MRKNVLANGSGGLKLLLREKLLSKVAHSSGKCNQQAAQQEQAADSADEQTLDELYGAVESAEKNTDTSADKNVGALLAFVDHDSLTAQLQQTTHELQSETARADKATARASALEAESANLRLLVQEKIRQLDAYAIKYKELEDQLAPLKRSCSAYAREAEIRNKRPVGEVYDEGTAADELAKLFVKQAHEPHNEKGLFQCMIEHPLMRNLANRQMEALYKGCAKFKIVERLTKAIKTLKSMTMSMHHWHAYSAILTAIAPEVGDVEALKEFATETGCSVKTLSLGMLRRGLIDRDDGAGLWYEEHKQQYRNKFAVKYEEEGYAQTIVNFQISISQASANKKDLVWKHAGGKVWHKDMPESCGAMGCESHPKYYRTKTYSDAYALFTVAHPTIAKVCSLSMYRSFEPYYFCSPEKSTCLCIYHERFKLLLKQYRDMASDWHGGEGNCKCACGFCDSGGCEKHVNGSHEELAEHLLCPKPSGSEYYKTKCVRKNCIRLNDKQKKDYCGCGWKYTKENSVADCKLEYTNDPVEFVDYVDETYSTTKTVDGETIVTEQTRKVKKKMTGTRASFMAEFRVVSADFFEHDHVARWQAEDFELLIANLPKGQAIFLEDFSMDYSHVHQGETQGEHWTHWSSTLFPVVVYYRDNDGLVWAHSYTYLSPDGKHDNDFVQHVNEHLVALVKAKLQDELDVKLELVHFVSDGCRGQFKLKKQWLWLTNLETTLGVVGRHRYFQSCHGKGPSDGLGATYKSNMSSAEAMGVYMAVTFDAFVWLVKKFTTPTRLTGSKKKKPKATHSIKSHNFYYVPAHGEVTAEYQSDLLPRSAYQSNILACLDRKRKKEMLGGVGIIGNFEYIGGGGSGVIRYRWLSHSCKHCIGGQFNNCTLKSASPKILNSAVSEKNFSGAAEANAAMKERVSTIRDKLKVGAFIALYQETDNNNRKFSIARVAKVWRPSVVGELVSESRPKSTQKSVLEVHFGVMLKITKNDPVAKYKFETGECCLRTYDNNCGEAKQCTLRHAHKVYVDAVLPPTPIAMMQHGGERKQRKKRQASTSKSRSTHAKQVQNRPEYFMLSPGDEQKISATLSDDSQKGIDTAYIVR